MRWKSLAPQQLLSLHFAGVILAGTLLLSLPIATESRRALPLIDAFFTSTSAVCVTGLIVIDTPNVLSTFGEVVLMLLIQAGGLGYMTIATLIAVVLGKRITLQERTTLQEALNLYTREGLLHFAMNVVRMTALVELTAAALLAARWAPEFGLGRAAYLGLFHAVSAFNNAGFSLFSDNLAGFRGDLAVNLVITTLIICGGLGFLVLSEVGHLKRRGSALSAHAKLTLAITAILIVFGTASIYLLEHGNQATLGRLGAGEAWLAAYFQAVTPRTAGFNTINIGAMTPPALALLIALMFIGASPGGTGGGIKTTTFGVAMAALWASARGRGDPLIFKRRLAADLVARAFAVSLAALLALGAITWLLLVVERRDFLQTVFESTSAFGTVGLSMGVPGSVLSLVGSFSVAGKLLLALLMYFGRVGPLTIAVALARGRPPARIRYTEAKILIG